jgi:NAD(P)-dependent dehydrogenase (short-subunit alcohol dehydrogenase family)
MTSFAGKTIAITGAASGIGKAVALLLAERGAQLVLVDIDEAGLRMVVGEIAGDTKVISIVADVAEPLDVDRVFTLVAQQFGHLDGLASNAGIIGQIGPVVSTTLEDYQRLMRVNAQSAFLFVQAYARSAVANKHGGSIVITSSAAGLKGSPGLVAYSMTKQALVGLTRSAAVELADHGVRVNAVCPGRIDTPLLDAFAGGKESGLSGRPIARAAEPREVAYLIAWLLSDEALFATGAIYPIDGGHTA